MEKLRHTAMKSVVLGHKENMKIESRNHIHSSKERKTVANKLNIWKATRFCKISNFPFISRDGLPFPTVRLGWCGHSALHQIRGSNRGLRPEKHTECIQFTSWRISLCDQNPGLYMFQGILDVCS